MAFDPEQDRGLRAVDCAHLFESSTTRIGLHRNAWLRGYTYAFIEAFANVYLAAAAHLRVDPQRCLVIEDTAPGAQAGLAAGATVWGFCPEGHGRAFAGLPVQRVFHHMRELVGHAPFDQVAR